MYINVNLYRDETSLRSIFKERLTKRGAGSDHQLAQLHLFSSLLRLRHCITVVFVLQYSLCPRHSCVHIHPSDSDDGQRDRELSNTATVAALNSFIAAGCKSVKREDESNSWLIVIFDDVTSPSTNTSRCDNYSDFFAMFLRPAMFKPKHER
eukprot:scaffold7774_cov88-Skeletonema_dohrnii-CCMP3373.AAC.1